jgi:hypothetical protein
VEDKNVHAVHAVSNLTPEMFATTFYFCLYMHSSVLARISKGQGAISEKGTFMRKRWLKKGTLFKDIHINIISNQTLWKCILQSIFGLLKRALISL